MFLDDNMVSAARNWVIHGLHPGSCTSAILRGDYASAELCAHSLLKTDSRFTFQEYYHNLRSIVPPCLLDNPNKFSGILNIKASMRTVLKFELAFMPYEMRFANEWFAETARIRTAYAVGHLKDRKN